MKYSAFALCAIMLVSTAYGLVSIACRKLGEWLKSWGAAVDKVYREQR